MKTEFSLKNTFICPTRGGSGLGIGLSLTYQLEFSDGNDLIKFEVNDFVSPGYGLIVDEFNGDYFHHKTDVGFTDIKILDKTSLARQIFSVLEKLFENGVDVSWREIENEIRSFMDDINTNLNKKIKEEDES